MEDEEDNSKVLRSSQTRRHQVFVIMPPVTENEKITSAPIQKFYAGTKVFITGATGFLGRLLVEKLLRSCPNIANIYLLIRHKKEKNLHERIESLFEDVVFDRLKEIEPKFRHKIAAIEGDVALPDLGINDQDRKLLTTEVSIVFHVAATVNFNEKLKLAVPTNVRGIRYLLKLCKEMVNLKAMVHVSTAYSNCIQEITEEKFYPSPINPSKLIGLVEVLNDEVQEKITKSLLGDFPNTYTYTKAVAENVIAEEGKGLPIGVFRPAIVTSTYNEPVKGWVNNFFGANGIVASTFAGFIRVIRCDGDAIANVVPADMTVNAIIAIPWDLQNKYSPIEKNESFEIPIYNYETSSQNSITWNTYMKGIQKYGMNYPTTHLMWYYFFFLISNRFVHFLGVFSLHYLPASIGDIFLILMAKKPRLLKFYWKFGIVTSALKYFSTRNFQYKSTRIQEMIKDMSVKDQRTFFCDLNKLNWDKYFKTYIRGIRIYLFKDPLSTLPKIMPKWRRLYWYHQITKVFAFLIALRFMWFLISHIYSLVS